MKVGGLDLDTKIIKQTTQTQHTFWNCMHNCEEWFVIFVKLGFMIVALTNKLKSLKHMALDFWACFTEYSYEYCLHVCVRSKPLKIWDKEGTLFLPFN
jgi:succinate dehydrogenase/fumarate reductase cytochrome b subunit